MPPRTTPRSSLARRALEQPGASSRSTHRESGEGARVRGWLTVLALLLSTLWATDEFAPVVGNGAGSVARAADHATSVARRGQEGPVALAATTDVDAGRGQDSDPGAEESEHELGAQDSIELRTALGGGVRLGLPEGSRALAPLTGTGRTRAPPRA